MYAVAYVKITDAVKSAFYTDAAGRVDSELAVGFLIQRLLAEQAASGASKDAMSAAITKELAAKESELGLKLEALEIRTLPTFLCLPGRPGRGLEGCALISLPHTSIFTCPCMRATPRLAHRWCLPQLPGRARQDPCPGAAHARP